MNNVKRFYQFRLLNVLISQDIRTLMDRLGWASVGDLTENKYYVLEAWNETVEAEVFRLINERLKS